MEPGTYIAIAQIAFQGACVAVKTFRKGLHFNQDAERLVLSLEVERFRLQIWGENAGLAPPDDRLPTLPKRLLPICDVIKEYLEQIERVVKDADGLSSRYGLQRTEEPPTKSESVRRLVYRMHKSIRSSRSRVEREIENEDDPGGGGVGDETLGVEDLPSKATSKVTTWKKARWAILDLDKFEKLVKDLAQSITKLNDLMTETQHRKTLEDNHRVNMVIIGSAIDEASLDLIRAAVQDESATSQVRTAVERKALAVSSSDKTLMRAPTRLQPLSLSEFTLPTNFSSLQRFITTKTSSPSLGPHYLLERKTYDPDILPQDMARLTSRIQRLVLLLSKPKSSEFLTPQAEGCIKDPANSCWWIAFRYPIALSPQPDITRRQLSKSKGAPISLLTLLKPTSKFRPALEQRLALASKLCSTFSELYLSGWLHKGVRSENILFPAVGAIAQPPYSHDEMEQILQSPLVCGFDYSRHESEWATIDKAKTAGDVGAAMYRHPNYQGEAAEGYKVQYDVYSVGLVLVEIALWMPLASLLEGRRAESSVRETSLAVEKKDSVELRGDMKVFYAPHAVELRRRVLARVENELAFRVGSPYCRAVKWCLEFGDGAEGEEDGGEVGVHPAMEFYDHVVVVLGGLVES
ncbi:hypothetical protein OQA88_1421 [Cercophora sp. LCS_1]